MPTRSGSPRTPTATDSNPPAASRCSNPATSRLRRRSWRPASTTTARSHSSGPMAAACAIHPGWLRHVADARHLPSSVLPEPVIWTAADFSEPPTLDGARILDDDDVLEEWLATMVRYGICRLAGTPTELDFVGRLVAHVGPIRDSNFGPVWSVRAKPDPDSTAYTGPRPRAAHRPAHTRSPAGVPVPALRREHGAGRLVANERRVGGGGGDPHRTSRRLRRVDDPRVGVLQPGDRCRAPLDRADDRPRQQAPAAHAARFLPGAHRPPHGPRRHPPRLRVAARVRHDGPRPPLPTRLPVPARRPRRLRQPPHPPRPRRVRVGRLTPPAAAATPTTTTSTRSCRVLRRHHVHHPDNAKVPT